MSYEEKFIEKLTKSKNYEGSLKELICDTSQPVRLRKEGVKMLAGINVEFGTKCKKGNLWINNDISRLDLEQLSTYLIKSKS